MPPASAQPPLRFSRFEIRPAERVLRVDGQPAALGARAFDLLLALARRRERLVTKQELLDLVWPGVVVEEHNITAQISVLRKLLGPQAIATVPGRGYQFVAPADAFTDEDHAADDPASPQTRHNLPDQRTRFIGREAALADLARLLPHSRLLTLTGIGGCGKTRLALQFAQRRLDEFADGVWFVDLAPLRESDRVAVACATALGLTRDSDAQLAVRIAHHLADRHALVVLDNCEHVRAGAAALLDVVLARSSRTRILATSREPLAVAGEQLYPVRSLSLPATCDVEDMRAADAVRVFVDRARLMLPEFEVDATNAAALFEICRRLDGIALAIELAAARVTMLSVPDVAARLEDRFRLLTGGSSTVARQRTLEATLQWSYDLLLPAEQRMLRELAVFAGGCTLEAAMAVVPTSDEYAALALLTALHDKSLLVVERGASATGGAGRVRYRMLETVRQYAQERLEASGEAEATRTRHAEYFIAFAEKAAPELRGPQQSQWMARLGDEHENLVAALSWCALEQAPIDPQCGLRLAAATIRYWIFTDVELGCRLALGALARDTGGADSAVRCQTLLGLSAMFMHRGQTEAALAHAQAALAAAQRMQVAEMQAMALNAIGTCMQGHEELEHALRYYEQARDLARAHACAVPLAATLHNIATLEFRRGRLQQAEDGLRQALHLWRARGDVRSALISLHNLLRVQVAASKRADAHACAVEAERLLRGIGENVLKLELLEVVAGLASIRGEHERAARFWGVARQRFTDAGYRRPAEDETQLEQLSTASRQALGDAVFDRAEAAGRALDVDAAMAELAQWLQSGG